MLKEVLESENHPIGWLITCGHHISCDNGHSYAMTTKTMAVGNGPNDEGPNDDFLVTPIEVRDSDGNFIRWDSGPKVSPLEAPFNCPQCGEPLGIK